MATYNKALRIKPAWPEGKWYFGTTLYELGRYDAALRAFSGLVAEQPLNGPAWGFKGLCEFQGKAYKRRFSTCSRRAKSGSARTRSSRRSSAITPESC